MKALHKAVISVFAREGEDAEKIKSALVFLVPLDLEKEKILVQQKTTKGFEDKKIIVYKIELEKTKHTNAFIKDLLGKLGNEQKNLLLEQADSRLDNHRHFFIRLDKTKLLNKEYSITEGGECFHIKLHIAAFPSKRDAALEAIEKLLKGQRENQ